MSSHPLTRDEIERRRAAIIEKHGPWGGHNIRLADGVFTIAPHVSTIELRARRLVQLAKDLARKSVSELRVLDLACYEGMYAIEFASQGAQVVGIEAREVHLERAELARLSLGLQDRLMFQKGDVRNLSRERHGQFDVVICAGIFYHLDQADVFPFAQRLAETTAPGGLLFLDTHVAPAAEQTVQHQWHADAGPASYSGILFREHDEDAAAEARLKNPLASIDNTLSFWPTRESLVNLLQDIGYTSVLHCLAPVAYDMEGRLTLVAVRGEEATLKALPDDVNNRQDRLAETSRQAQHSSSLLKRFLLRLRG